MIHLQKKWNGSILDIGGGGEGIIGRLYGEQVVSIDKDQAELDDAPDSFAKVLMDATNMSFADGSFEHVSFFFSLMYMDDVEQRKAIMEASRVLKPGGELHIWDCTIASAYPEPYCVDVDVQLPSEQIHTTYGIGKLDGQDEASITRMCLDTGLSLLSRRAENPGFSLHFHKTAVASEKR